MRRWFVFAGAVALLLAAAVAAFLVTDSAADRADVAARTDTSRVRWASVPTGFSDGDRAQIRSLIAARLPPNDGGHGFAVQAARIAGHRGAVYGDVLDARGDVVPADPVVFLVQRRGQRWALTSVGDSEFCGELRAAPAAVMSDSAKELWSACE